MKFDRNSRNALISVILGDGYLSKQGSGEIVHCAAQKEYLIWKRDFLVSNGVSCSEIKDIDNSGFPASSLYIGTTKWGKLLRRILYKDGYKNYYSRKLLNRLSAQHIAILYMDDGSISSRKDKNGKITGSVLTISTCTTRENNQILIDYFKEVWGVRFGQRKMKNSYALICGTKEARKFLNIVREYVSQIPSMTYKLNVKP